ncbi:hypothetical protein [uncultured Aquitalea sp.]|uniref:hypothetical protein n=1 Tax=uncultured Aquitalea sp. TaxID=540272 RepID=UPI0025CCA11C|nr:hypothetical protein [uncultured Aquitalea sp.]
MLTLKRLPLVFFLLFFSCYFSLSNPGYFWDDWVWIFKGKEEAVRIGRELGIWWGGYATYAINSLPNPALAIRWFVFIFWGASSVLVAKFFREEGWVNSPTAFVLATLHAITPVALVRYQTSVAFYCLYIACFWLGALIISRNFDKHRRLFALPFFFFSFYLNSLLVLYVLLLAYFFFRYRLGPRLQISGCKDLWVMLRGKISDVQASFWVELSVFIKLNAIFVLLPVIFYVLKWVTTQHSQMYADYNAIQFSDLIWNAFQILPAFFKAVHDLLAVAFFGSSTKGLVIAFVISYFLLILAFQGRELLLRGIGKSIVLACMGIVFGCFAILPYVLVGKPPILTSYYEGRHILPGLPAVLIFLLGCISAGLALVRHDRVRVQAGYVLISCLFASFSMTSMFIGADVWRDWIRQDAISGYVKKHAKELSDVGTFIMVDRTSGYRVGDRQIWNYEYTGNLIYARGGRGTLGVDVNEYRTWGNNELLFHDGYYRERYNISQYDFSARHVFLEISNGDYHPSLGIVFAISAHSLLGRGWEPDAGKIFDIALHQESRIYPEMMESLRVLSGKLEDYKKNHGYYPLSNRLAQPGSVSLRPDGSIAPIPLSYTDTVGGGADKLIDIPNFNLKPGFVYYSNGQDYKLIYRQAPDYDYAKIAISKNSDLKNSGYGFWTEGAKRW